MPAAGRVGVERARAVLVHDQQPGFTAVDAEVPQAAAQRRPDYFRVVGGVPRPAAARMLTTGPVTRLAGPVRARASGQARVIYGEYERAESLLQPHRARLNLQAGHDTHRPPDQAAATRASRPQLWMRGTGRRGSPVISVSPGDGPNHSGTPWPARSHCTASAWAPGNSGCQRDGAGRSLPAPGWSAASAALPGIMPIRSAAGTWQRRSSRSRWPGSGPASWAGEESLPLASGRTGRVEQIRSTTHARHITEGPAIHGEPHAAFRQTRSRRTMLDSGAECDGAQNIGRGDRICAYGGARIKVDLDTIQSADNSINHIACRFSDPPQRSLVSAANPQTSFT